MEITLKHLLLEAILALMASEVLQEKLATYEQPFSARNCCKDSYYHAQCHCFKKRQIAKENKIPLHQVTGQTTHLLNSVPCAEHANVSWCILTAALTAKHHLSPSHQWYKTLMMYKTLHKLTLAFR